jgi:hypothetical protein
VDGKLLIVFDDLPFPDGRGLVEPKINLVFHAVRERPFIFQVSKLARGGSFRGGILSVSSSTAPFSCAGAINIGRAGVSTVRINRVVTEQPTVN